MSYLFFTFAFYICDYSILRNHKAAITQIEYISKCIFEFELLDLYLFVFENIPSIRINLVCPYLGETMLIDLEINKVTTSTLWSPGMSPTSQ